MQREQQKKQEMEISSTTSLLINFMQILSHEEASAIRTVSDGGKKSSARWLYENLFIIKMSWGPESSAEELAFKFDASSTSDQDFMTSSELYHEIFVCASSS